MFVCVLKDNVPIMSEICVQLMKQNGLRGLPSAFMPSSLLPNRRRRVINAELHSHSAGVTTKQPSTCYEVLSRPVSLSQRERGVTTSHAVYEVNKRSHKASVLHSLSDSNILAESRTSKTDRLKTGLAASDVELEVQGSIFPSVVGKVSSKKSDVNLQSSVVSHQGDSSHDTEVKSRANHSQPRCTLVNQLINKNVAYGPHMSSDAPGHLPNGQNNKGHSQSEDIPGRPANGGRLHLRANKRQIETEPVDSGFLSRAAKADDEEFLEYLTKSYGRLLKARNRSRPSKLRQAKMERSSDVPSTELCVVGQSFVTHHSPANNSPEKITNNHLTSRHRVDSGSEKSHPQTQVHPLQVVISGYIPQSYVHQQTSAAPLADSSMETVYVPTDSLHLGGGDVISVRHPAGKIHV